MQTITPEMTARMAAIRAPLIAHGYACADLRRAANAFCMAPNAETHKAILKAIRQVYTTADALAAAQQ